MHSRIISVAHHLPEDRVRTHDMLAEINPEQYNISPRFIAEKIGIEEVRHSKSHEKPSDLAIKAAQKAFSKTSVKPKDVGVVIFCGIERDYIEPSTAHVVQAALDTSNAFCFDVGNACLGFMTGLQLADNMIRSGTISYALVCTGETASRVTKSIIKILRPGNYTDYRNLIGAFTVGDSGAAAIIGPKEGNAGFLDFNFYSQGKLAELCYYKHANDSLKGQMLMKQISQEIIKAHRSIYNASMEKLDWQPEQVKCFITHQVGRRVFDGFSKIFNADQKKMTKTYDYLGNITSATFGVNLSLAMDKGQLSSGDKVFIALTGSGLSVGQVGMVV